ncbi:MAG: MBL fold metallo-hydrolase [Actinobacteria bacterium]|nr:MBL fold metallo-hydrolase [Actinomycetota bacterium]
MIRTEAFGPVTRIDLCADLAAAANRWSACYLVEGILFDAAMHHGREELAREVEGRAELVALTHCHEDHCGGASALAGECRILAPGGHLELLANPEQLPAPREFVWGRPEPVRGEALGEAIARAGRRFEVITTPGHCPPHVAFLERNEGWAFAGDLVAATKPRLARAEEDVPALMASLRAVRDLHPERLFLAHLPVPERATEPIESLLGYLEDRASEVRGLADAGAGMPEIVERAFGGEVAWWRSDSGGQLSAKELTGGDFSTENLVRELLRLSAE